MGEMFYFGRYVLNMGDVTGDGADDIFASAFPVGVAPFGGVRMMRGINLETVWEVLPDFDSGNENRMIGMQIFSVGDLNDDEVQDCAFTIYYMWGNFVELNFRSRSDGQILFFYLIPGGQSLRIVKLGDINNDGIPDFVRRQGTSQNGQYVVFSGADGSTLIEIPGAAGDPHASIPDIDGDGLPEFVVHSQSGAAFRVWSPGQQVELHGRTIVGDQNRFSNIDAIDDLDGDGRSEILIGRSYSLEDFAGAVEIQPVEYAGCLAELNNVDVRHGALLSGDLRSLRFPDNSTYDVRSAIGFSALEPDVAEIEVAAGAHDTPQDFVSLQIDLALTQPNGQLVVHARNWQTKMFDLITTESVGMAEVRIGVPDLAGASYVRADDGAITLRLRTVVPASFSALGFDTAFDWVDVITR